MNKIIIIGAGISGLSAGCYGQMNGYETEVFEMHNISGGLCTSWKRKGYNIDGCINFLTGTNPDTNFHRVWKELGAIENRDFAFHDIITRVSKDGREFVLYSDIDKLEKHMLETAPEDEKVIRELMGDVRKLSEFNPPIDKSTIWEKMRMVMGIMPYAGIFGKYRMSVREYAEKYKNPLLRYALANLYSPNFPAIVAVVSIANYSRKNSGFPIGGSQEFAKSIEKRYLSLGGKIHFKSRVESVLVEKDRAVGVRLRDGSELRGDIVISAGDAHNTIFKLLEGKYLNDKIRRAFEENVTMTPYLRVYLGVNRDLSNLPHTQVVELGESFEAAGEIRDRISIHHYCFDKNLAPEGKSLLMAGIETSYDYWNNLRSNPEAYGKEKQSAAEAVIGVLDKVIEGIKENIEMIDVVTPKTYERYTNNWQGSYMGWMPTPETMSFKLPKTLPGLEGLYMAGHWMESLGGLPTAALTGRDVIKLICRGDRKKFTTTMP